MGFTTQKARTHILCDYYTQTGPNMKAAILSALVAVSAVAVIAMSTEELVWHEVHSIYSQNMTVRACKAKCDQIFAMLAHGDERIIDHQCDMQCTCQHDKSSRDWEPAATSR